MGMDWKFSRNMFIIREEKRLILINSVRLTNEGLVELEKLGDITDVIRLGALHGRDDAFYVNKYKAKYWAASDFDNKYALTVNTINATTKLPIKNVSFFQFKTTQMSEIILFLNQDNGIAISCDALQNWLTPDEYFCDDSTARMKNMGFFQKANVGPVWLQAAQPEAEDFKNLKRQPFKHALCGHGEPLLNTAKENYLATFFRLFNV